YDGVIGPGRLISMKTKQRRKLKKPTKRARTAPYGNGLHSLKKSRTAVSLCSSIAWFLTRVYCQRAWRRARARSEKTRRWPPHWVVSEAKGAGCPRIW